MTTRRPTDDQQREGGAGCEADHDLPPAAEQPQEPPHVARGHRPSDERGTTTGRVLRRWLRPDVLFSDAPSFGKTCISILDRCHVIGQIGNR